jgi:hypothetical protein
VEAHPLSPLAEEARSAAALWFTLKPERITLENRRLSLEPSYLALALEKADTGAVEAHLGIACNECTVQLLGESVLYWYRCSNFKVAVHV